jgi:hypothetical protein
MYSSLDADGRFAHPASFVRPSFVVVHVSALLQITRSGVFANEQGEAELVGARSLGSKYSNLQRQHQMAF